jgi:Tol biopolymer transport system component/DNA-binding winged helix-turn-helix (wHTH) protein
MSGSPQLVASQKSRRYRFGTFELEAESAELRRNGVKLRLQEQPFLVLRTLLENAGAVVSREQLQAVLWPADTFVDFDTSLNTAIKRLREVLGDSADVPVFIETIPRRGYRFLTPVQVIRNGDAVASGTTDQLTTREQPKSWQAWRPGLILGGLFLAALAGGATVRWHTPAPLPRILDSNQLTYDGHPKQNLHARAGHVFFDERIGNHVRLIKLPEVGGIPWVLDSSFPGLELGSVSPDGTKLLVGSIQGVKHGLLKVRIMDLASRSLQDLDGVIASDAYWTPAGRIIFSRGHDVFLIDPDGSHEQKLLTANGYVSFMRFSPDGKRLRFSVGNKYLLENSIWEAKADGSQQHEILTELINFPDRCCGDWSPDGRYYFFQTTVNGGSRIWAQEEQKPWYSRKTPAPIELTTVPPNYYIGGFGAENNHLLVMASQPRAELVRYDAVLRQFVPFLGGISAGNVEASHDGVSYVYVRYPEETLWRSAPDGTEAVQLTGPTLRASLPHWSADGKQIAFAGMRQGKPWSIFMVPAQGGPAEQLTTGSVSDLDPTWSPDGKSLAFGQIRSDGNQLVYSLQLLDVASRKQTPIPGTDGVCCPRWSPDGKYLVATHDRYDDVILYDFSTQKWTTVVKGIGTIGYMEWSNDSKSVMFDTSKVELPGFYRVRVSDGKLEKVADIGEMRRYYGTFGPWTGAAADGSPLIVRDISNEEIYSLELQLP